MMSEEHAVAGFGVGADGGVGAGSSVNGDVVAATKVNGASGAGDGAADAEDADVDAEGEQRPRAVTITVVSAGVTEPSTTSRLGDAVALQASAYLKARRYGTQVRRVDLRDLAQDIAVASVSWHISPVLQRAIDKVTTSDGLVVASPIFKASYSGLFKSFWDVMEPDAILDMPVALTATGGSERHALMTDTDMRSLFAFMRAIAVPTSVVAATKDWASDALSSHEQRAGAELGALIASNVRDLVLKAAGSHYRRSFTAVPAQVDAQTGASAVDDDGMSAVGQGLDFDSSLMRLAAGGIASDFADADDAGNGHRGDR